MAKKSVILKNWPKYLLQWGVLAALIVFITGIIPSKEAVDPEAYCPMGGLQALATYLSRGSLPCSMSSVQVMMGIALVADCIVLGDMKDLKLWFRVEDLKQIAENAETSEQYSPWNVGSENISHIVGTEQNADPHPELQ